MSFRLVFEAMLHTSGDVCARCASFTLRFIMARPRPLGFWFLPFGGYDCCSVEVQSSYEHPYHLEYTTLVGGDW